MKFDRLLLIFSIGALVFLAFLVGGISTYYKYPPYNWINEAEMAKTAYAERSRTIAAALREKPVKPLESVATVNKLGASQGYTLYTPRMDLKALLIDMDGKVVHEWGKPFSQLWPDPKHISRVMPDARIHFRDAIAFPNGDLLATIEVLGDTPYGYGLIKLDKDSNVLWRVDARMHHQIDVDEEGKIYGTFHEITELSGDLAKQFTTKHLILDWATILSPEGKELDRFSIIDAVASDPKFRPLAEKRLSQVSKEGAQGKRDVTHVNSIMALPKKMAAAFPMFAPGDMLISIRHLHLILVVEPFTHKVKWAANGPWRGQHDARYLDDGTIMIFDNLGVKGKHTRILKHDPKTGETDVMFEPRPGVPFFTVFYGMSRQLPNQNILMTEADKGRLVEVTPDGNIVWEFLNPYLDPKKKMNEMAKANEKRQNAPENRRRNITSAKRYTADELPFLKNKAADDAAQ
jgi:hypothetical protein